MMALRNMTRNMAAGAGRYKALGVPRCAGLALAALSFGAGPIRAQAPRPLVVDTSLIIDNLANAGAAADHTGISARLQATLSLDGAGFGANGLSGQFAIAAFAGEGLSARLGDLQGVSNIAAPRMVRPLNAWLQYAAGGIAAKAGIIDTNADFDEQNIGAIFLNSSHGMGPDLGTSGLNGGGAAPFSALGIIGSWSVPETGLKLRAGLFGGRPGDPDVPERWSWRLGGTAGSLTLAELDWTRPGRRVAIGGWHHSTTLPRVDGTGDHGGSSGGFVTVEAKLWGQPEGSPDAASPRRLDGWLRLGLGDQATAPISTYVGGGLVWHGWLAANPQDALGLAVAHARVNRAGDPTLRPETAIEFTIQHQMLPGLVVQPDAQYLIHTGAVADGRDALVLGVRLIVTH